MHNKHKLNSNRGNRSILDLPFFTPFFLLPFILLSYLYVCRCLYVLSVCLYTCMCVWMYCMYMYVQKTSKLNLLLDGKTVFEEKTKEPGSSSNFRDQKKKRLKELLLVTAGKRMDIYSQKFVV